MVLCFLYFTVRLIYLAFSIAPGVPPDEAAHFGIVRAFSQVLLLPENSTETYRYGLVNHIPYLYYWLMGKLLALNFFALPDLVFLRLCNIPLALGTVWFVLQAARLVTDNRWVPWLVLIAMTNTAMFTFLSASVSYDNLANFLAALASYCLLVFFRTRSGDWLVGSWLYQLAGCLTKVSFLPLALLLNGFLLAREYRVIRNLPVTVPTYLAGARWRRALLLSALVLGTVLAGQLCLGNYLRYGTPQPPLSEVVSVEAAMQNRLEARDLIFSHFREGKLTKDEALKMAARIESPSDRADAGHLVEHYDAVVRAGGQPAGPLDYAVVWSQIMWTRTFGIAAHLTMEYEKPPYWIPLILVGLMALAIGLRWRMVRQSEPLRFLAVTAGLYTLILMFAINYPAYRYTISVALGVQGRYLFPVLGSIYTVGAFLLWHLFGSDLPRKVLFATLALLFLASDLPFFLSHLTPAWLSRG